MKPRTKEKAKRYTENFIKVGIVLTLIVAIGYYVWNNTFFTIVPPDDLGTGHYEGEITWTYYPDRPNRTISPDFVSELTSKRAIELEYLDTLSETKSRHLPYNKVVHEFVSKAIGPTVMRCPSQSDMRIQGKYK